MAIAVMALIRNAHVYRIRMAILNDPDTSIDQYRRLPSYDCMFGNPTQWCMWTVNQYKKRYL